MRRQLCAALLALLPVCAQAQPGIGQYELTLSGSGNSSRNLDRGGIAATGEYGYYLSPHLEVGIRQSFSWADSESESNWNGATRIYADRHFGSAQWRPYVGGSIGAIYGNDTEEALVAGPEAGIKYYVQAAAFLFAQVDYNFFFEDVEEVDSSFDDGVLFYSFGAGYNF